MGSCSGSRMLFSHVEEAGWTREDEDLMQATRSIRLIFPSSPWFLATDFAEDLRPPSRRDKPSSLLPGPGYPSSAVPPLLLRAPSASSFALLRRETDGLSSRRPRHSRARRPPPQAGGGHRSFFSSSSRYDRLVSSPPPPQWVGSSSRDGNGFLLDLKMA